ncbi:MAG: PP2C family serine/threonine-protein phosphatase [Ktedonobacteraceae bacterium]
MSKGQTTIANTRNALTFVKVTSAHQEHPERNEDYGLIDRDSRLAIICDGVGCVSGADLAARTAARTVKASWRRILARLAEYPSQVDEHNQYLDLDAILPQLLSEANQAVLAEGERLAKRSNGTDDKKIYAQTTIALVLLLQQSDGYLMGYAHIGDSRIYLLRKKNTLQRLTADDGYFEWKINKGEMNAQDAWRIEQTSSAEQLSEQDRAHFDKRNGISQSLGGKDIITCHVGQTELCPGDRVLLCTDGIHDNLTDAEIEEVLRKGARTTVAQKLLNQAAERSQQDETMCLRAKKDDMSAIVITCHSLLGGQL